MSQTASPEGSETAQIAWRPWSRAAFEEAVRQDRPVLLSLSAVWCQFCRLMDETTFADPSRVARINDALVPVRVDVDRRPHVQERYIAGGWPTTAFLTPTGEVLWAGTYVEPAEFDQIAEGVLAAWTDRRNELRVEVERRRKALEAARSRQPTTALVRREAADDVISGARQSFDARNGGFGSPPKFPYPDAIDLLLVEAARSHDNAYLAMAERTLDGILAGTLWDDIDGGFFRYALQADWTDPRQEKLLETNALLLRAFALGAAARGREDWRRRAEELVAWADRTLRRDDGLWAASQQADPEYWALPADARRERTPPEPDRVLYAGLNAYWIHALAEAGGRLDHPEWIARARAALPALLDALAAPGDLLYHYLAPGEPPAVPGLLVDTVECARACLRLAQATGSEPFLAEARRLVQGAQDALWADAGGFYDHLASDDDVAAVRYRDRPFEANADAARLVLDLHLVTGERGYRALAERILATLSPLAGRYEIAGAGFALATEEFFRPPLSVVLVGTPEATASLREAALRRADPDLRVWTLAEGGRLGGRSFPARPAPAAYVVDHHDASGPITDPALLRDAPARR